MEKILKIPEGVEMRQEGNNIAVKGPKGELKRTFRHPDVGLKISGREIKISTESKRRKVLAIVGTWVAHLGNMLAGVQKGYEAKLKMVYSHFPTKLGMEGRKFVVSNFLGEKKPRSVEISEDVKIDIKKDDVTVSGTDKEQVGQAALKIEQITKITKYDRRVFQDGCYLVKKAAPIGG